MLEPNVVLQGRYRIVRSLGRGGMGAVYEAIDERFRGRVALKEALVTEPELARAFEREARLLRTLKHRALPGVIDYFREGASWFLVMDFIQGEDLAALAVRRGGPFPVADVLDWGDQILEVLEFLHGHRPPIVHRDVKPQNLKLTGDGRVVLLDFGLSKGLQTDTSTASDHRSVHGYTPHFAPLEQIRGVGTDARSDLYAVAATLWSLSTGAAPPDALHRAAALVGGAPDPLRPAHEVNPLVPEPVSRALHDALAQTPERRPPSAADLRRLLREAVGIRAPRGGAGPVAGDESPTVPLHRAAPTLLDPRRTETAGPASELPSSPGARPRGTGLALVLAAGMVILVCLLVAVPFVFDFAGTLGGDGPGTRNRENRPPTDLRNHVGPAVPIIVDLVSTASPESAAGPFGGSGVRLVSGTIRVEQVQDNLVVPAGSGRVLVFVGPGFTAPNGYHAAEVTLEGVATAVTLTRPGVRNNASTPAWQVQAFDAAGAPVGNPVGEGDIVEGSFLFPAEPKEFTITAPRIKTIRFASNNRLSTFGAIPLARVAVTLAPR
jgi:hypothetical protein